MTGPPDHPFASEQAENRIRLVAVTITVLAVGLLVAGIVLLFVGSLVLGGVLVLVGITDLIMLPFISNAMRRRAIEPDDRR